MLRQIDLRFDSEWAAFSPDGGRVAVTGRGGQVAVIDVATGAFVRPPLVGHDGNVVSPQPANPTRNASMGG